MVSPVTVLVSTLPTVTGDPLDGVMTYPVMALPPLEAGAVQVTVALALPAVAVPMVGAPGTATIFVLVRTGGAE